MAWSQMWAPFAVPRGVSVWRDDERIVAAAFVEEEGFTWAGPDRPADAAALATRAGRLAFPVDDEVKTAFGGDRAGLLEAIVSGGVRPLVAVDDGTLPPSDAARVRRFRQLQSHYRQRVLAARPGRFMTYAALGSYLDAGDVRDRPALNFIHPDAYRHAQERDRAINGAGATERGTLDFTRLTHNLLSSMPLCFNLFGALRREPELLPLFRAVFDPAATRIDDVVCEWSPRQAEAGIGDRTAFDAFVRYDTADGPRFVGIETKYTEPFSDREYASDRYDEVTRGSGWFIEPAETARLLRHRAANQLWRNVMLAAAYEMANPGLRGSVAVVALGDDKGARAALDAVGPRLADRARLTWAPLETILDVADTLASLREWSAEFRRRYVAWPPA